MPHKDGTLQTREFVFYCEDVALAQLGSDFPAPQRKVMWTILQLHYGNPDAHFEIQPHMSRGQVEVGLHFEGPVEANDRYAAALADRAIELMCELGDGWELEEWTVSWRRLHRVFHFEKLHTGFAREVGEELAKAMRVLQPFAAECAEGYVAPVRVAAQAPRPKREWGRKKARV
jgi:hypothetical protein